MGIFEIEHEDGGQVFPSPTNVRVEKIQEKIGLDKLNPALVSFLRDSKVTNPTRVTVRGGIWYFRTIKEFQEQNIEGIYSTRKARRRLAGEPPVEFYAITPEGLVLPVPGSSSPSDPYEEWDTFGFGGHVHMEGKIPVLRYIEAKNLGTAAISTLTALTFNPTSPN